MGEMVMEIGLVLAVYVDFLLCALELPFTINYHEAAVSGIVRPNLSMEVYGRV